MKKHGIMLYDCLIKTKHFAKRWLIYVLSVISARSRQANEFIYLELEEPPSNGGLIDEGPKVAKRLGR